MRRTYNLLLAMLLFWLGLVLLLCLPPRAASAPAECSEGNVLLKVETWDAATGKLCVHLPLHNLKFCCHLDDERRAGKWNVHPGEIVCVYMRQGNMLEIKGRLFRVESLTLTRCKEAVSSQLSAVS